MATLDDIFEKLVTASENQDEKFPSVVLDETCESGKVITGLMNYFGEDDNRRGVTIMVGEVEAGLLTRDALYDLATISTKGIGSLELSFLPGEPEFKLLELRCPVPGCNESEFIIHYDPSLPKKCPLHPDHLMELAP